MKNKFYLLFLMLIACTSLKTSAQCNYTQVETGQFHSLAIKADGTLWGWGRNTFGQVGDGTTVNKNTPTLIDMDTTWSRVTGGYEFSAALKKDGTLWTWGRNSVGQLGDGTLTGRLVPTQVGTDTNWAIVSAGKIHAIAIKTDGTLWAWGWNQTGQLGDGTTTDRMLPVQIGTANDWLTVSAGYDHSTATKNNGTLWAWGKNDYGQLGDGTHIIKYVPTQIGIDTDWQRIAASNNHTLAIKNNGTLWAWGRNNFGQVGDSTWTNKNMPTQIDNATDWQSITTGDQYSIAIKNNGSAWGWGWNTSGQLGLGASNNRNRPYQIGSSLNWQNVAAEYGYVQAIQSDGSLWSWGWNPFGQLGNGTTTNRNTPGAVSNYGPELCNTTSSNNSSIAGTTSATYFHSTNLALTYFSNCDIIATIKNNASSLGNTQSTVTVLPSVPTHNGQPFVARWYEITPANTAVSAELTIYFTQDDFDNYNAYATLNNWSLLPANPTDATGIANVRVTKNDNAGLGTNAVVLTPSSVIWNALNNYWEVKVNTPGFSQFRVHAVNISNAPLAMSLLDFYINKEENTNLVSWKTVLETNSSHFNILHSTNGSDFQKLGSVKSLSQYGTSFNKLEYHFIHKTPVVGHNYYRLEQVDIDGSKSYSEIIKNYWTEWGGVRSYPNPTRGIMHLDLGKIVAKKINILDMTGKRIKSFQPNQSIEVRELPNGMYILQVETSTGSVNSRFTKE